MSASTRVKMVESVRDATVETNAAMLSRLMTMALDKSSPFFVADFEAIRLMVWCSWGAPLNFALCPGIVRLHRSVGTRTTMKTSTRNITSRKKLTKALTGASIDIRSLGMADWPADQIPSEIFAETGLDTAQASFSRFNSLNAKKLARRGSTGSPAWHALGAVQGDPVLFFLSFWF